MYSELKEKGFHIVAINNGDSSAVIQKYVGENNFTFPIAMAGPRGSKEGAELMKQYGIAAFPTNYLLDSNGTVVFRSVGFDEAGLRKAIEKLDLK